MKAVDFAVSQILPEDLRQETYDLSKKGMASLLANVASRYPERFREISKRLGDLGRNAAWYQGYSTTAEDTLPVIDTNPYFKQMDAELSHLKKQRKNMDDDEFEDQRNEILQRYSSLIEKETMKASKNNAFAQAVVSGARGNPAHVKAILSTPGIFTDTKGRIIPLFVRNSFANGVRPAEMLAGTYGARLSVVSTKKATAKGGDLLKLWQQNVSNYNVTEQDCGTDNGLDLDPQDESLSGRVLARPLGDIPAGTVIDRSVLKEVRKQDKPIIARSAMTCRAKHGICARCAGVQAGGKFPNIGDSLGITAASAIGEPIVQGSLNTKHCISMGCDVLMADGSAKKIEQITAGDMVIGSDNRGVLRPTRVVRVFENGLRECNRYLFQTHRTNRDSHVELICTPDHKVLSLYGRNSKVSVRRAEMFTGEGHRATHAALPQWYDDSGHLFIPEARMVGVLLGDGCITGGVASGGLSLSCYDPSMVADLREDLAELGLHTQEIVSGEYRVAASCASAPYQVTNTGEIVRNTMKRILTNYGVWGCAAGDKTLPPTIHRWDNMSVARLIAGLIATDGWVGQKQRGVGFSSNSSRMLHQIKNLLFFRFGISSSAVRCNIKRDSQGNAYAPTFQFQVSGKRDLQKMVDYIAAYIPGRKRVLLQDYSNGRLAATGLRQQKDGRKLMAVESVGMRPTFDIEVEHEDHLFVLANGIIVSNSGGMAKGKKSFSGLDTTIQFVQIPEEFKDKAAVAELDGVVEAVEPAPQGGTYITVNGQRHFAMPGYAPMVKVGEKVEAGDILSDGLANPADIVRLRGLGEGRRYYAERLGQILADSGNTPDKRHMELVARAVIDDYRIDDPDEDAPWLPDDMVRESEFLGGYKPPADAADTSVDKAIGSYLQKPVLHFTVGTKVTPKIAARMRTAGVQNVLTSRQEPWFKPDMKRLRVAAHDSKDWLQSLGTSYLSSQMRDSLERADETNVQENPHYGPRLAYGGDAGKGAFGEKVRETGMF